MRVHHGAQPRRFRRPAHTPDLPVAQEYPLLRHEPVNGALWIAGARPLRQAIHQGHVGQPDSAIIGRVLSQREFSVQLDVVDRGVFRILLDEASRALFELRGIL